MAAPPRRSLSAFAFLGLLFFSPGAGGTTPAISFEVQVVRDSAEEWHVEAKAEAPVPFSTAHDTITDYDHMAEFIPNIAVSHREIYQRKPAVRQIGQVKFLWFSVRALAVFLVSEEKGGREIDLHCVEGKFRRFDQQWTLEPAGRTTQISYRAEVLPSWHLPQWLLRWRVRRNIEASFHALLTEMIRRSRSPI